MLCLQQILMGKPYNIWQSYLLMWDHLATFMSGASSSTREYEWGPLAYWRRRRCITQWSEDSIINDGISLIRYYNIWIRVPHNHNLQRGEDGPHAIVGNPQCTCLDFAKMSSMAKGLLGILQTIVLRFLEFVQVWLCHGQIHSRTHIHLQWSDASSWACSCGRASLVTGIYAFC
jgi:hypothetical protein